MKQNTYFPKPLKLFLIALFVLSIFFRFINIDKKVYWGDEVHTAIRTSGHTAKEASQEVFSGRIIEVESLQKYVSVSSEKNFNEEVYLLNLVDVRWFVFECFIYGTVNEQCPPCLNVCYFFPYTQPFL